MKAFYWLLRFLVPVVVLYVIGYYVSGFSALTFTWLVLLGALIYVGDWFILKIFGKNHGTLSKFLLDFLISTVVIFTVTLAIEGGQVPLGSALVASFIISTLHTMIPDVGETSAHI